MLASIAARSGPSIAPVWTLATVPPGTALFHGQKDSQGHPSSPSGTVRWHPDLHHQMGDSSWPHLHRSDQCQHPRPDRGGQAGPRRDHRRQVGIGRRRRGRRRTKTRPVVAGFAAARSAYPCISRRKPRLFESFGGHFAILLFFVAFGGAPRCCLPTPFKIRDCCLKRPVWPRVFSRETSYGRQSVPRAQSFVAPFGWLIGLPVRPGWARFGEDRRGVLSTIFQHVDPTHIFRPRSHFAGR